MYQGCSCHLLQLPVDISVIYYVGRYSFILVLSYGNPKDEELMLSDQTQVRP